jgi:predicted component of type VI protein secretion system
MAKLVLLSTGFTGRTQDLKVDKTTIGRVEDNVFQIAEPSVSSHHCEVLPQGNDVLVRDLGSTNGTFINGEKVTSEAVLKIGQILRLGQVEMRLESDTPSAGPMKKPIDQTMVVKPGVTATDLEQSARAGTGFGTKGTGFTRKDNKANKIIITVAVCVGVVILLVLGYILLNIKS